MYHAPLRPGHTRSELCCVCVTEQSQDLPERSLLPAYLPAGPEVKLTSVKRPFPRLQPKYTVIPARGVLSKFYTVTRRL